MSSTGVRAGSTLLDSRRSRPGRSRSPSFSGGDLDPVRSRSLNLRVVEGLARSRSVERLVELLGLLHDDRACWTAVSVGASIRYRTNVSAASSMSSRTSSRPLISAWMSSRSNGVTKVASRRWPISWLISSPRCSSAGSRPPGPRAGRRSGASPRGDGPLPGRSRHPRRRGRRSARRAGSGGVARWVLREPELALGAAGRLGETDPVQRHASSGRPPAVGDGDRVPRPRRLCDARGRMDWIFIAFVGAARDRAGDRESASPSTGSARSTRPARRLLPERTARTATVRRGSRGGPADAGPPAPGASRRVGVRARPAGPQRRLPGRPDGRRDRPSRRRRPGRARERRRPPPPAPAAGEPPRPDDAGGLRRRPGRGPGRDARARAAARRASSGSAGRTVRSSSSGPGARRSTASGSSSRTSRSCAGSSRSGPSSSTTCRTSCGRRCRP